MGEDSMDILKKADEFNRNYDKRYPPARQQKETWVMILDGPTYDSPIDSWRSHLSALKKIQKELLSDGIGGPHFNVVYDIAFADYIVKGLVARDVETPSDAKDLSSFMRAAMEAGTAAQEAAQEAAMN